ncbi:MAG: erythromycin esterase family protein [Isosphaeraceae bacterium]|nr:erythromycin esterase family protein [Isosphaeraceae bacterium]
MAHGASAYSTLNEWIAREAIPFSVGSPAAFNIAVGKLTALLGESVELLGLGEPLHGGEDFLLLRNRLFERLVEAHGYTAIAIESSFPKARMVNEYIAGRGAASYEDVREAGFSHGFGRLEANP